MNILKKIKTRINWAITIVFWVLFICSDIITYYSDEPFNFIGIKVMSIFTGIAFIVVLIDPLYKAMDKYF